MSEKPVSVLELRVIRESIQELGDLVYDPMNRYGWGILESEAWNQLLLDLSSDARRIEREYQRKK